MEDQSYIPVEPFRPEIDGVQRKSWKGIQLKIVFEPPPAQQLTPAAK